MHQSLSNDSRALAADEGALEPVQWNGLVRDRTAERRRAQPNFKKKEQPHFVSVVLCVSASPIADKPRAPMLSMQKLRSGKNRGSEIMDGGVTKDNGRTFFVLTTALRAPCCP